MKNLHQVISDEIARLRELRPMMNVVQAARNGAIKECIEAIPVEGETPLEWAERNAAWFQCPVAGVYRDGFFDDVEAAGEMDYHESLK